MTRVFFFNEDAWTIWRDHNCRTTNYFWIISPKSYPAALLYEFGKDKSGRTFLAGEWVLLSDFNHVSVEHPIKFGCHI